MDTLHYIISYIIWIYCSFIKEHSGTVIYDVSLTGGFPTECRMTVAGHEYVGRVNTTTSGRSCQAWASNEPHYHYYQNRPHEFPDGDMAAISNYCRNPDNTWDGGVWCYTMDVNKRWEHCSIPLCECKVTESGLDYQGQKNMTSSGKACQMWTEQTPHSHDFTAEHFPEVLLRDTSNYCRNPNETHSGGPWCYTTSSTPTWEYCHVPSCTFSLVTFPPPTTEPTTTTILPTTTTQTTTSAATTPTTTARSTTTPTTTTVRSTTTPTTTTVRSTTTPTTTTVRPATTATITTVRPATTATTTAVRPATTATTTTVRPTTTDTTTAVRPTTTATITTVRPTTTRRTNTAQTTTRGTLTQPTRRPTTSTATTKLTTTITKATTTTKSTATKHAPKDLGTGSNKSGKTSAATEGQSKKVTIIAVVVPIVGVVAIAAVVVLIVYKRGKFTSEGGKQKLDDQFDNPAYDVASDTVNYAK